ncbi:hypothetical protein [Noviherbaspirillum soli]|uniref:hypothetical protein n=1 Tax=Noviherbaspirillum soli TaxID=1064518 RepID=UPI00188A2B9F|nr:hypothetical protein [Noviherbaspirillum soli]
MLAYYVLKLGHANKETMSQSLCRANHGVPMFFRGHPFSAGGQSGGGLRQCSWQSGITKKGRLVEQQKFSGTTAGLSFTANGLSGQPGSWHAIEAHRAVQDRFVLGGALKKGAKLQKDDAIVEPVGGGFPGEPAPRCLRLSRCAHAEKSRGLAGRFRNFLLLMRQSMTRGLPSA